MISIVKKITAAVSSFILTNAKSDKIFAEYYKRTVRGTEYRRQATNYRAKEIKDWTMAMMVATDPDNPRRGNLMRFYQSLMLDLHLMSCIDNRTLPVQCAPFRLMDKNQKEDTQAKKLLEKPWFMDLIRLIAMGAYQGTTLIEMIELNDKGELKEVTEIPQSNFIAQKGIVVKEEYDEQGVSYKEGVYRNYYIQIGNDWNLGLFSIMASIVLAKKLGLGSWMSFIEKFGIPPIFAITDRMDTARRDELFEMLSNFRMNHFAVLQGNEKIEVPDSNGMNAYHSFDDLLKKCDEYISKYLLGGTGLTDEKAYVGSATIQEHLLKYRQQVDKLVFKYYLNEEVFPRLVSLSSVYQPLANLTFEYDETETLTLKEILEAIKSLSQHYEFDIEELVRMTGLPIVGVKKLFGAPEPEPEPQKKKSEPGAKLNYPPFNYLPFGRQGLVYAATWDKTTERIAEKIWEEKMEAKDLDKDLTLKYYSSLNESTKSGWGKGYYTEELTGKLRNNLLQAAGAKSYRIINELSDLKKQHTGKDDYTESAKKLINLYNATYQVVENKFAANSAGSARDYNEYVKEKDIYPCLMNRTMGDNDVRDAHAVNEGVVKPVEEWTQIPPYDPGCRCWLEQTTSPATTNGMKNLDGKWANNPALSGKIFTENNTYFTGIPQEDKLPVKVNTEQMKEYMPYNRTIRVGEERTVFVNDFADRRDLESNLKAAKLIAEKLEKDVYIRPHKQGVAGEKNPELGIGRPGILGDLKTMPHNEPGNFFNNQLKKANKQGCQYVVVDISKYKGDASDLKDKIKKAVIYKDQEVNQNVKRLIIIRNKSVIQLSRMQIIKDRFSDLDLLK
ncbi:hypothetical protein EZS27_005339 [termite gut metagenome]|uniref:tRNA nuclease CdiA C-terminal domain-containing protein n=1 Tax=termite gut metagenome TaxID=433724 RepID=A0A5J4SPI6_9ZZZZ